MTRAVAGVSLIALLSSSVFGQAAETRPTFDIADVHVSAHVANPNMRGGVLRAGRYEILTANMVDLIRTAYGVDADKVLGGPSWLEWDRFDVIAKAPQGATAETAKLMLQALLADRFKLVVHKDSHPLPAFALTVGKGGPKLKEADASGEPICKSTVLRTPQQSAAAAGAGPVITLPTYSYACTNMTMAAFADGMRTMLAAQSFFATSIIVDQTALKGAWDFNFKYTPKLPTGLPPNITINGELISIFDAVDKQLGLKLDAVTYPTSVIIVDSVNEKPSANPSGVSISLPPPPAAEFEVADLRLSERGGNPGASAGFQPSGRVDLRGYPLKTLIMLAWDVNVDMLVGIPKWVDTAQVDLIAKMPAPAAPNQGIDLDMFRPALKALLIERFKLMVHQEDRPVEAYTMTAPKPKLKKADPLMRTGCKEGPGADGKDPRTANPMNSRLLTCQNVTMAQLAEQLQQRAGGYIHSPIQDDTGLDGAYDLTLNFAVAGMVNLPGGGDRAGYGGAAVPGASDPNGAITLPDAMSKQLGLKLELKKRPMPVLVIDHIEEKPSDN
jgi:uncharacterized protein (TIGR03435 family)